MLDSEHPDTTQPAVETGTVEPKPVRRRRSASRPAGPPAAVTAPPAQPAATDAAPVAAEAPAVVPDVAPAAESAPALIDAPVEAEKPKRTRRSRATTAKKADPAPTEPLPAAPEATAATPAVPEPVAATEPVAAAEPVAAVEPSVEPEVRTPARRRRAVTKKTKDVPIVATDAPVAPDDEVVASLVELVREERPLARRRVKAETFGLTEEATPDQVLDSLAAAIGGFLTEPEAPAADDEDAEEPVEGAEVAEDVAADQDAEPEETDESEDSAEDEDSAGEDGTPRRRRRRRGGRRRRRSSGEAATDAEDESADAEPAESESESADDAEASATDEPATEGGSSRRRRRRRRRGEDSTEPDDDSVDVVVRVREPRRRSGGADEVTGIEGSTRMEAKKQRRREGRAAGRRRTPILSESEFLARRESVDRKMLIRQAEDYSQIAVLEDNVLVEHYVDRASAMSLIGNIYLGRVQNVLPSMEAAFVDIGRGRNAVLYAGEIDWESFGVTGQDKKVEKVFKSGQTVLVQVSKDPVGAKGARLTSHISIPGRYIVYAPGGHLSGISRKLPEGERKRLKSILDDLIEPEASVIVRTAAEGASEEELIRDVNRLKAQWEVLEKRSKTSQAPEQLYAEPDLTVRIVRDLFTEDFGSMIVDGNGGPEDAFDTVQAYVGHVAPHLAERIQRWDRAERGDIFDNFRVHEQVSKALERKVFLPSGGSLIIDRTEAMTVIDVNTGKFTGTSGNLEATVTANNLEAADEIVRQLRLRDIGGIIVVDFIDMVLPANRELLLRRLVECLGRDRTRHQVTEVTSLGLVQMTRKKIGTGLAEAFTVACETCKGRGYHVHDAPVASQAPADGGDRDAKNRGRRSSGNSTPSKRSGRGRKSEAKTEEHSEPKGEASESSAPADAASDQAATSDQD